MTEKEMKVLIKSQQGEIDAVLMYQALARVAKNKHDSEVFLKLASEEGHHGVVFKELTGQTLKPKRTMYELFFSECIQQNFGASRKVF